jgi:hypothetical protein
LQISVPFLKWHTLSFRGDDILTMATKLLENNLSTTQTSSLSEEKIQENNNVNIY